MALAAGTRLGHFEVRSPLGAGGMGEVYRARDLDLDRDVALKVLPDAFAADPQRLARFAREARAAAALNHPNIVTVFEVGTEGRPFVAAELLSGGTLRTLLGRPLPVARAVDYAIQIANGLAAAHATGIVHRDIKPENLFITPDGRVKILDFGIAVHAEPAGEGMPASTLTVPGSHIGTPGYMAPEQVRGAPVDARADLFALGAVLYEMLTGTRAFHGPTSVDATTAILTTDPPSVTDVVPDVPSGVARVVRHCLAKSRDERFQAARDVGFALESAIAPVPVQAPSVTRRRWTMPAAVLVAALVAAAVGARFGTGPAPSSTLRRLSMTFPDSARLSDDIFVPFSLSPDGSLLAYVTSQPAWLNVRRLDGFETTTMAGSEGAFDPFFSPDNQWIGFWAHGQIKKLPVAGGPPVVVCPAPDMLGASWAEDDSIVFAPGLGEGLFVVPASGGTPQPLTTLDESRSEMHHAFPQFLDGGRAVLFTAVARSKDHPSSVELFELAAKTRRTVMPGAQYGRYLPSGHLLFVREGKLFAVKLAQGTQDPVGQPMPLIDAVHAAPHGFALYSVANDGTLAYVPPQLRSASVPVWVDRSGSVRELGLPARSYHIPRLSPDGKTMAINISDGTSSDVWTASTAGTTLERLTFGRGLAWSFPSLAFSSDGRHLAFAEDAESGTRLVTQALDRSAAGREWLVSRTAIGPSQWLRDGGLLVSRFVPENGGDLFVVRPSAAGGLAPVVEQRGNQFGTRTSADERYVAYASDETGRFEVFVAPFPGPGERRQLTMEGGSEPSWSPDGREIFFRSGDRMMSIPVTTASTLTVGQPRLLFEGRFVRGAAGLPQYDVAPDGRFLMLRASGERPPTELRVVLNWLDELRRRVP